MRPSGRIFLFQVLKLYFSYGKIFLRHKSNMNLIEDKTTMVKGGLINRLRLGSVYVAVY